MTNVTANEMSVLRAILTNDYTSGNGRIYPDDFRMHSDWVWSNCIDCAQEVPAVTGRALAAVCSTLAQKGLVVADGNKGRDACIRLTEEGFRIALTKEGA